MNLGWIIVKGCWEKAQDLRVHSCSWVNEQVKGKLIKIIPKCKLQIIDLSH